MGMKHYTGSDLGSDFRQFFTKEKKRITKVLTDLGCTDVQMSRQFYYFYGFFTAPNGQIYYFNSTDTRSGYKEMYVRTAKSYSDFNGGRNLFVDPQKLNEFKFDKDLVMSN